MQLEIIGILSLGFILGLKHALDADHLIAVTAMVSNKKSLVGSSLVGASWGLGHTISLLCIGLIVIVLDIHIPKEAAIIFESCVAIMLIMLGAQLVRKLYRGEILHIHENKGHKHSLLIGMIHGIAGSAALMLLILTTIDIHYVQILYITIFGIGSIIGMMLMSTLIGLPFMVAMNQSLETHKLIRGIAGLTSIGFGLYMVYYLWK